MQAIQIAQFSMTLPPEGVPNKALTFEISPRVGQHPTDRSQGAVELIVRACWSGTDHEAYSIRAFFDFVFEGNRTGEDVRDQERVQKTLIGMSFSTLRGILFEKLAGTPYAQQLLITVDTNSFITAQSVVPKKASSLKGRLRT